jgi:hypothetical protein
MKEEAAERLAHAHYRIDPTLKLVRWLKASPELEADPDEPIKLLEVNDASTADGIVPIYFGPHPKSGLNYPSLIVEIAPEEYEEILRNPSLLPHGWQLGDPIEREVTVS